MNLSKNQINVVTGSLLGDGWLQSCQKETHNSRLCKQQSSEKEEYIKWHHDYFQPYSTKIYYRTRPTTISGFSLKESKSFTFLTISHPYFTELRHKWYPGLKDKHGYIIKEIPRDLELNAQMLAVWFADDGSNDYQSKRIALWTQGFFEKDINFLVEQLQQLGLKCKKRVKSDCHKEGCGYCIVLSSESYIDFIEYIKPYFYWKCLNHKINTSHYNVLFGHNTSGHHGINWDQSRNKWRATISVRGKHINLGRFIDIEDAITARKIADEKYNVKVGRKWQEAEHG